MSDATSSSLYDLTPDQGLILIEAYEAHGDLWRTSLRNTICSPFLNERLEPIRDKIKGEWLDRFDEQHFALDYRPWCYTLRVQGHVLDSQWIVPKGYATHDQWPCLFDLAKAMHEHYGVRPAASTGTGGIWQGKNGATLNVLIAGTMGDQRLSQMFNSFLRMAMQGTRKLEWSRSHSQDIVFVDETGAKWWNRSQLQRMVGGDAVKAERLHNRLENGHPQEVMENDPEYFYGGPKDPVGPLTLLKHFFSHDSNSSALKRKDTLLATAALLQGDSDLRELGKAVVVDALLKHPSTQDLLTLTGCVMAGGGALGDEIQEAYPTLSGSRLHDLAPLDHWVPEEVHESWDIIGERQPQILTSQIAEQLETLRSAYIRPDVAAPSFR